MNCPTCNVKLVMSDRNGIEIDYCPDCRGVWLDRGELDKIIERSNAPVAPSNLQQNSRSQPTFNRENPYYEKKKKGLLGELFDF